MDSISAQLYIMSIEPLLLRLRKEPSFKGLVLPFDGTVKLTAYADDINLYVTHPRDIIAIHNIINVYQTVSNAKVNWTKSCGLKVNGWDIGQSDVLSIKWKTTEQKFLGGE